MEEKRSQKRVIFPYIILVMAMVSTALILSELWANVGGLVTQPLGPTPTATFWWRATPTPPAISIHAPLETPAPGDELPWRP